MVNANTIGVITQGIDLKPSEETDGTAKPAIDVETQVINNCRKFVATMQTMDSKNLHGVHFTKSYGEQKKPARQTDRRKLDKGASGETKFEKCKRLGLCYECESKDHRAQDCVIKQARLERWNNDNSRKRKGKPSPAATATSSNALAAEEESEHDSSAHSCWNMSVDENDYLGEPSRWKERRVVFHNYIVHKVNPQEGAYNMPPLVDTDHDPEEQHDEWGEQYNPEVDWNDLGDQETNHNRPAENS